MAVTSRQQHAKDLQIQKGFSVKPPGFIEPGTALALNSWGWKELTFGCDWPWLGASCVFCFLIPSSRFGPLTMRILWRVNTLAGAERRPWDPVDVCFCARCSAPVPGPFARCDSGCANADNAERRAVRPVPCYPALLSCPAILPCYPALPSCPAILPCYPALLSYPAILPCYPALQLRGLRTDAFVCPAEMRGHSRLHFSV